GARLRRSPPPRHTFHGWYRSRNETPGRGSADAESGDLAPRDDRRTAQRTDPAESKVSAGRDSRDVQTVPAEEAKSHHVRIRDAEGCQRHHRGRAAPCKTAGGNQSESESDSAQSRPRHSV